MLALGRRKPFHPVDIVVSDPDHDQVRQSVLSYNSTRLPGEIARPDDFSAQSFLRAAGRNQSSSAAVFCRHQRNELLQSFVDAEDAFRGGIRVEEPVFATFGSCSPKHAPRCRYIKIQREAVANHRNVWQSTNQFAPIDSAASVFQIIGVERRGRLGNALAVIRARYRG